MRGGEGSISKFKYTDEDVPVLPAGSIPVLRTTPKGEIQPAGS